MRIALYGGSFNPIHIGHIKLALTVIDKFKLDKLIIMPTYCTPLKDNSEFASSAHRLNMCRLAVSEYDKIEVSDMEIKREGNSYTYLTVNSIKELYPNDELFITVGADMFVTIDNWKYPEKIFSNASVIVVARNGGNYDLFSKLDELKSLGCKAHILTETVCDISSTQIRNGLKSGCDISKYLNKQVLDYIKSHRLYGVI